MGAEEQDEWERHEIGAGEKGQGHVVPLPQFHPAFFSPLHEDVDDMVYYELKYTRLAYEIWMLTLLLSSLEQLRGTLLLPRIRAGDIVFFSCINLSRGLMLCHRNLVAWGDFRMTSRDSRQDDRNCLSLATASSPCLPRPQDFLAGEEHGLKELGGLYRARTRMYS